MRIIAKIIKKITISLAFIFSYNIFVSAFGINVAVNPYSVGIVSMLGIPGLISMVILKLLIK